MAIFVPTNYKVNNKTSSTEKVEKLVNAPVIQNIENKKLVISVDLTKDVKEEFYFTGKSKKTLKGLKKVILSRNETYNPFEVAFAGFTAKVKLSSYISGLECTTDDINSPEYATAMNEYVTRNKLS